MTTNVIAFLVAAPFLLAVIGILLGLAFLAGPDTEDTEDGL